jgi:hypothetical protein
VESNGGQITSSQDREDGPIIGLMQIPLEVLEEIGAAERASLGLESYYQSSLAYRNGVPPGSLPAE